MSETYRPSGIQEDRIYETSVERGDLSDLAILNKISWGGVFAGVVVALVVQVLLTMLGAGIGVAALHPGAGDNPEASTFSIAAGIWYVVASIIAAFVGGYVAARMSGKTNATTGALHGITAWALTTLLVLYLLTSTVGALVGGAFSGLAAAIETVGQTVAQTAGPLLASANPMASLEAQVRATGNDPEALNNTAINAMRSLVLGDQAKADDARKQAAQALSTARGIPLDQAAQRVAQIEKEFRDEVAQAKQHAVEAAATAASITSRGALAAFVTLVLGAIAAWLGGRSGVMNPVHAERITATRRVS